MTCTPRAEPTEENTTKSGRMIITPGMDCSPTKADSRVSRPRNSKRVRQYAAPRPKTTAMAAAPSEETRLLTRPRASGTVVKTST